MPSHYAHYRFGIGILNEMPEDIKNIINRSRITSDAYLVGLQGPDILAFYMPYIPNALNREGQRIHHESGLRFFSRAARITHRLEYPEAYSYVIGSLCHYMLDSTCHPLVKKYMKIEDCTHSKVEREFDNHLLRQDGKKRFGLNTSDLFPANTNLGEVISPYYESTNPRKVIESIVQMDRYLSLLASKNAHLRSSAYNILSLIAIQGVRNKRDMIVTEKHDHVCDESCRALTDTLEKTVPETVREIEKLMDTLLLEKPLSDRLKADYLGNIR